MRLATTVTASILLLACLFGFQNSDVGADTKPQEFEFPVTPQTISGPIVYRDLMLIVMDRERVVAFAFGDEIKEGVRYEFRSYSVATKKETIGAGSVFRKFKPLDKPPIVVVDGKKVDPKSEWSVDDGSVFFLKADSLKLGWTYQTTGSGWIYYEPEKIRVQIAHSKNFKKIDLTRFIWK